MIVMGYLRIPTEDIDGAGDLQALGHDGRSQIFGYDMGIYQSSRTVDNMRYKSAYNQRSTLR